MIKNQFNLNYASIAGDIRTPKLNSIVGTPTSTCSTASSSTCMSCSTCNCYSYSGC